LVMCAADWRCDSESRLQLFSAKMVQARRKTTSLRSKEIDPDFSK
jgi:hypothetical protein